MGQNRNQLLNIWDTYASDHVVSGTGVESAIAAGFDVSEGGRAEQRINERIEKWQQRFVRLGSGFIHQGAKAGPNRRATTRPAYLGLLALEYDVGALVRIGGQTYVRH